MADPELPALDPLAVPGACAPVHVNGVLAPPQRVLEALELVVSVSGQPGGRRLTRAERAQLAKRHLSERRWLRDARGAGDTQEAEQDDRGSTR